MLGLLGPRALRRPIVILIYGAGRIQPSADMFKMILEIFTEGEIVKYEYTKIR